MRTAYALQGAAFLLLIVVAGILLARSAHAPPSPRSDSITNVIHTPMETSTTFSLTSPAFAATASIPAKYTCDGDDTSPELRISGVPSGARSLVLIVDDPDASKGIWDHWIVFNISPSTALIKEGTEPEGIGGNNSWGKIGYGGPCPGQGEHHYQFRLYALDTMLDLQEGATKQEIETAMQGHILTETTLVGLYERSK